MGIYKLIEKKKREQKKKENIKKTKMAALTATIGVSIGAAIGVLFAPKAGKETRSEIAEKASEVKEKLAEKGIELKENISTKAEDGKKEIKEAKGKIADYLGSKKNKSDVDSKTESVNKEESKVEVE